MFVVENRYHDVSLVTSERTLSKSDSVSDDNDTPRLSSRQRMSVFSGLMFSKIMLVCLKLPIPALTSFTAPSNRLHSNFEVWPSVAFQVVPIILFSLPPLGCRSAW